VVLPAYKTSLQFRLQRMGVIDSRLFADTANSRLPVPSDADISRLLVQREPL
jgi:hypothetical protein